MRFSAESVERLGPAFFGVALVALGAQNFIYQGFLAGLEFVPEQIPVHTLVAFLYGAVLVAGGLSFALERKAEIAGLVLAGLFFASALTFLPRVTASPLDLRERTRLFEMLMLCGGALVLAGIAGRFRPDFDMRYGATGGRVLLAICMVVFGLSHLIVPKFIAALIPAWVPAHLFWAYFTGVAMIGAGLSFALRIWMRTAGLLLGSMFVLWVVILHWPRIAGAISNGNEWNSGFVCLAAAGCSFAVAESAAVDRCFSMNRRMAEQDTAVAQVIGR